MDSAHIVILLGLYNGAKTLEEQLESLAAQTHKNWSLIISDDGSEDEGPDIAKRFAARHPDHDVRLIDGPGRGFQMNFLHLVRAVPSTADFAAFCDQDDVWMPDRLSAGLKALTDLGPNSAAIHCGRTLYCDESLVPLRKSPEFKRRPSFQNALVQSIAGANTYLMTGAAVELLKNSPVPERGFVSHDWWAYQVVTATGGTLIYDPVPRVRYRLHGSNAVGANDTTGAALSRVKGVMAGRYGAWNAMNMELLKAQAHLFTAENKATLAEFEKVQGSGFFSRLHALRRSGVYRQGRLQTLALWIFAALGRL